MWLCVVATGDGETDADESKFSYVGDYSVDGDDSIGDTCNDVFDENSKNVIVMWSWSKLSIMKVIRKVFDWTKVEFGWKRWK